MFCCYRDQLVVSGLIVLYDHGLLGFRTNMGDSCPRPVQPDSRFVALVSVCLRFEGEIWILVIRLVTEETLVLLLLLVCLPDLFDRSACRFGELHHIWVSAVVEACLQLLLKMLQS